MAHSSIIELNQSNFESEVKQAEVPVLVDFWAEWCGPCRMLGPVLDEIAGEMGDKVKIGKVNVDDNRDLSVEYNVKSIPLLLFFKGGEVAEQITGVQPKEAIIEKLNALA